jgi:signal transduction histidine kinase
MTREKSRVPSRRWFALAGAGLIAASAGLITLGARSIVFEARLLKKQAEERLGATADATAARLRTDLEALLDPVRRNAAAWRGDLVSVRRLAEAGHFFLSADGRITWPRTPLSAEPAPEEWAPGPYEDDLRAAEKWEFTPGRLADAVTLYQALLSKNPPPAVEIHVLKAVAAAHRKLKQPAEALAVYAALAERFGDRPDPAGWPLAVLARARSADVLEESGDRDRARTLRAALWEDVLYQRWPMTAAAREKTLDDLQPRLDGIARRRAERRRADAWRADAARFWKKHGAAAPGFRSRWGSGRVFVSSGTSIAAVPTEDGAVVGVLPIDFAAWIGERLKGAPATWTADGDRAERDGVVRSVWTTHPPLTLRFAAPDAAAERRLFRQRAGALGGMIALSLLTLAAALVFAARALRRESETASLKTDFVANVSHELRTPLSSIAYIGERLAAGRVRSEAERGELHDMLRQETDRLKELVDRALDFSRSLTEGKGYDFQTRDLGDLAAEALRRFEGKARARDFVIAFAPPPDPAPVRADGPAVVRAVMNLLDNALKYSGETRRAELAIVADGREAGVAVRDFGVGIAPTDRERIFEKFVRLEHHMKRTRDGGVGLGLAMVKNIMDAHGGRVELDSAPGRGSVFTLWFPREEKNT